MGILLPPVSTAVPNLTAHHRNRSLDSALQRIPEVDVTPSPECEGSGPPRVVTSSPTSDKPDEPKVRPLCSFKLTLRADSKYVSLFAGLS